MSSTYSIGSKDKSYKILLQLCDFLSSKIHDFISNNLSLAQQNITLQKKIKALKSLLFSKNWAKNKDLGRIKKLDKFVIIVYSCTMTDSICSSMNLKGKKKPEDCHASGNGSDSSLHYLCVKLYRIKLQKLITNYSVI